MADFGGSLVANGTNCSLAIGQEATTYGVLGTELWSSLIDEISVGRVDEVYEGRGITSVRTPTVLLTTSSRYNVSIKGKVDSGIPFAMIGGAISKADDPLITIFRGASHVTPTKVFLPSWSVKRTFDDESDNLTILGTTFGTGTFSCDLDGPWMFDLSGVGKSQTTDAATGVSIPTTMLGSWNTTVAIDKDATSYSSSDGSVMGLKNVSFTINQNTRSRNEFGTVLPIAIRQTKYGVSNIELTFTRGHIDDDLWTIIADGGVNSFNIATTDGTVTLSHNFNECSATSTEQTINLDDETTETCTMTVRDWTCTVTDGITYPAWV